MKRFALLFGALALVSPVIGCDGGGNGSPTEKSGPVAAHPNAPAEVKEYEEKRDKALADRAAKVEAAKAAKSTSKNR